MQKSLDFGTESYYVKIDISQLVLGRLNSYHFIKICFSKKQYCSSGFDAKIVDFLVEHKRLTKIGVKVIIEYSRLTKIYNVHDVDIIEAFIQGIRWLSLNVAQT